MKCSFYKTEGQSDRDLFEDMLPPLHGNTMTNSRKLINRRPHKKPSAICTSLCGVNSDGE